MSTNDSKSKQSVSMFKLNGKNYLFAFILITSLFALWGFANDITNPMVAAFKNILLISNFESSLVQFAFYGGYCFMAIPAALFIRKYNYKKGILVGLALYSTGCFLFIPAGNAMLFWAFLIAYFVMTCGLAFLETTSNPYILSLGPDETATRRLNFAQAFNPIGSLTGMLIAKEFILARLHKATEAERLELQETNPDALLQIQQADLDTVSVPYLLLGGVVLCFFIVFLVSKLPHIVSADSGVHSIGQTVKNLLKNKRYVLSVVAQAFYVGVQIMIWTFIIQYAELELGMSKATAQGYNMLAMGIFVTSRFICTFLLKYFKPSILLTTLAIGGGTFTLGAIFIHGIAGLYSLVAVSACMSLMFPTIYGIALKGMGDEAKLASAGLILAIGGGCVMPPLQGLLIDKANWFDWLSPVRISFILPFICFVVIAYFGYWVYRNSRS
ncbi:MAG: L-fucose:H+ symporter permease [Prevotellaceae bacterium]|jgi:FHS family L-fucose permease-like MFS transporter|nr:L-fucose:H+ symporter permease [Prevotellaceae bacterium]